MKIFEMQIAVMTYGLTTDVIRIEKRFVEGYQCPKCFWTLTYRGFRFANDESVCFGICEPCDYARRFYFNSPWMAAAKRRFSSAKV